MDAIQLSDSFVTQVVNDGARARICSIIYKYKEFRAQHSHDLVIEWDTDGAEIIDHQPLDDLLRFRWSVVQLQWFQRPTVSESSLSNEINLWAS